MVRRALIRFAVLALAALAAGGAWSAQQEEPGSPRSRSALTILQINDVYSTVPVDDRGGLARVATIKRRLQQDGRMTLLVLAGDFLSPSVASSVFKGEQMIAALNAAGLDIATLGNHEFDFGDRVLAQRMREARWQWLVANVVDQQSGRPIGGALPYIVRLFGNVRVGFIGLCLTTSEISRDKLEQTRLIDPFVAAAQYLPQMKREGAQVIVAVTHLTFADDRRLVQRFPDIDIVIGGHEHYPITALEGHALISKAGSEAQWVARIDVAAPPAIRSTGRGGPPRVSTGRPQRFFELIPVTSDIPDDVKTADVVESYQTRLSAELDTVVARLAVPLEARSVHLRAGEQAIGNLFADAIRADVNAEAALTNSGSIRGDRVYPAGDLTRRTLLAMHPFGNVVCKVEVPGAVLLQALNHGVARFPAAAGQFPQVSGLTFTIDAAAPVGNRVRDAAINGQPIEPARHYTLAVPDFVLKGGDNYSMLTHQRVLVGPEAGNLLVNVLEKFVAAQRTVAPKIEGRIRIVGNR
jgi:2',3'-cyclic-nucleotide 2'-phosphodiesterase (5'-nucleotidase family)